MVNGISGLSTAIQAKIQSINIKDGLSAEEAKAAGLTQAEIDAIRAAGIAVDADVKVEETEGTTKAAETTAKANIQMPAEIIDEVETANLKAQIQSVREDYAAAKADAADLAKKIDDKEAEFDALRAALSKAVQDVEDAAIDANEEVSKEVWAIKERAKAEGWDETKTKQALLNINIPSISGEQRTLQSAGIEVEKLAKVICDLSDLYAAQADTVDKLADRWGGFLEVDLDTIYVNTSGTVVVNELGTKGPEVSGADGVSALDMQKFSTMTNDELTQYLQSNEGNALLTAMQGMANQGVNLSAADCAAVLKNLIAGQDKSTGDVDKFGTQFQDKLQVNVVNGATKEELEAAIKKINPPQSSPKKSCDPYVINIDGVEYTMILDNKDGKWDTNDILGINDDKNNLFAALKGLESDGDTSNISGEELAKAGIRLVAKDKNGKLALDDPSKDFDLSKVSKIDISSLKQSADNDGNVGTFGNFNLELKDGRTIQGAETFEEMSTLQKLFGAVKEFFDNLGNVASDIISKLKMDAGEKEWYSNGIKEKVNGVKFDVDKTVDKVIESSDDVLDETNQEVIQQTWEAEETQADDDRNKVEQQQQQQQASAPQEDEGYEIDPATGKRIPKQMA